MKIDIISNINMDSLKFYLKEYSFNNSCSFGNYYLDLIDVNSKLYRSDSEFIILFLDFDELEQPVEDILNAVKKFVDYTNKCVILNTLSYSPYYMDTFLHKSLESEIESNRKILEFAKDSSNVLLFDFSKLLKQKNFIDDRYWYMARIKFTKEGFEIIAKEIDRLIKTYKFGSKKVLILDLDNTLWGGIIGEEKILLSNEGEGKVYVDFQKKIKKLKNLGILLAICSKNNYEDGIKGFRDKNSILKEDDFIAKKINWQDKATNIKEIAKELNLGESSFVFIDDNPVERELVKSMLPEVVVPDFPKDIYRLNSWFVEVVEKNFAKVTLTKEDLKKQEQYVAKIKREQFSKKVPSYKEFLQSLNIELEFYIDDDTFLERYAQMTQKTNQFNLTTKRYSSSDIKKFINDDSYTVLAVNYKDKFANEGITGLVILKKTDKYEVEIDIFLLSCRILKRGVEKQIMNKIEEMFPDCSIIGYYYPTAKNSQVKDLYLRFGFAKVTENRFVKEKNANKSFKNCK